MSKLFEVSTRFQLISFTLGLMVVFSLLFGVSANAQSDPATNVKISVPVTTYISKDFPINLDNSSVFRTIDGTQVLRYKATNIVPENFSAIRFLLLTVDKKGTIKSGQGWMHDQQIASMSSSEHERPLTFSVSEDDSLILTAYQAVSDLKVHNLEPTQVLTELADKGLVKIGKKLVKTAGGKLVQQNPCAAAETAASAACSCGVKSFSCNPQTGAYSYTCFSQQENPSGCPEGPPEG